VNKIKPPNDSHATIANEELLTKTAEIGARAAWSLHRWDVMDSFVQLIPVCKREVVCVWSSEWDIVCIYIYI
jgi:hypothetical protein